MADFDEELRRQAAISSLLAQQPESQPLDTQTDEQVVPQPEVIKPDTQADYHRLINQAFDTKTDEQVTAQPDTTVYPTIAQDQGQPDKKFDTAVAESVVPYGERATPEAPKSDYAPKDTGKGAAPEDYPTIAQDQGKGESSGQQAPDALNQVERATLVKLPPQVRRAELIDPDPDRNYFELNKADKPVPGFVPGSQNAILNPAAGVIKPDPTQGNLGDEELARQILAGAPDKLAPRAQPAAPKATIVQDPIVTRSIAKNIADQSAPTPTPTPTPAPAPSPSQTQAPAPSQAQVTQPASSDDYNKLMDSFFPSAKTADTGSVPTTGEFQPDTSGSTRLNARTNNPGALGIAKWEEKYGVTSSGVTDTGHYVAQFPTKEAGAAAQFDLWRRSGQFRGQTLKNAITNWIGPGEHGEAEYISQATGIPLNQVIDEDFLRSPAGIRLMQAQAHYEGANVLTAEQWKRGQDWAYGGVAPTGETSTVAASTQNKMPWDDWAKLSPADQAAAEKEGQDFRTQQMSALDKLNRSTPNPKQFWEMLQQPIEGVTDAQRQAYAENWKKEATQSAVDFYSQKGTVAEQHVDPEEAFKKAISDPGFDAYVGNVGRGLAGAVGQADIGIALAGKSIDNNRVDGFAKLVHPESTGEGRAGFIKTLTDIQDTRHRHDVFNQIYGDLPQNTKDAIGDPASILDSIDHLASPEYQAQLNKGIATKKAWVDQQLAGDPQLRGTGADWWTTGTGENLFNTVAALVPGGVGAVVRTSTLGAQMYSANMDRIAKEHPDLTPEQVSEEASKSAFMTLAPQEAVLAASHGLTAPLLKWAGALAEKPLVRFGIGGGVQAAAAGVGGALGQVGENVAENKDPLKDVPQAAGAAVVQSLPFVVHGGLHGVAEGPPVKPEVQEPVPTTRLAPEPAPAEPAPAPETSTTPVSRSSILGPEETGTPPVGERWYDPGPIVTRGVERTAFSPQELSQAVNRLSDAGMSPDQIHQVISQLQPGYEQGVQNVHLGAERDLEAARTQQIQANRTGAVTPDLPSQAHAQVYRDLVASGMSDTRARNFVSRAKGNSPADILMDVQTQMREGGYRPVQKPGPPLTVSEAIAKSKAEASLGGAPKVGAVPKPGGGETPQPVKSFITAKGSTYEIHEDGTTTRNKAYRPEHGTAEQGPQERSHRTIYVTPADAQKLGEIQIKGGPAGNIEQASNGQWGVRYREGKDQGKFERRTMVNHSDIPTKGSIPVELWDNGKRVHFGNEITEVRSAPPPHPAPSRVSEAEPFVSKVANRYTAERMATGELGQVDPSQGKSTEELVRQGIQMTPNQREGLIDNFVKGKGGDLDQQGAAIRSKEAILSVQSTDAARRSEADPTNQQLKADADAALKAVTDFHNGPIKKLKRVWSDSGRGLMREIPLDYTTLNGMKEAYTKGAGNGKEAPPEMEPKLKQTAAKVSKSAQDEQAAVNQLGQEIEKRTRGKSLPSDDSIRSRLMEIMKDLPCRN